MGTRMILRLMKGETRTQKPCARKPAAAIAPAIIAAAVAIALGLDRGGRTAPLVAGLLIGLGAAGGGVALALAVGRRGRI